MTIVSAFAIISFASFNLDGPPNMKLYVTYGSPYARLARIIVIEKALEDFPIKLASLCEGFVVFCPLKPHATITSS
jgi:hypothetical protein